MLCADLHGFPCQRVWTSDLWRSREGWRGGGVVDPTHRQWPLSRAVIWEVSVFQIKLMGETDVRVTPEKHRVEARVVWGFSSNGKIEELQIVIMDWCLKYRMNKGPLEGFWWSIWEGAKCLKTLDRSMLNLSKLDRLFPCWESIKGLRAVTGFAIPCPLGGLMRCSSGGWRSPSRRGRDFHECEIFHSPLELGTDSVICGFLFSKQMKNDLLFQSFPPRYFWKKFKMIL